MSNAEENNMSNAEENNMSNAEENNMSNAEENNMSNAESDTSAEYIDTEPLNIMENGDINGSNTNIVFENEQGEKKSSVVDTFCYEHTMKCI